MDGKHARFNDHNAVQRTIDLGTFILEHVGEIMAAMIYTYVRLVEEQS